MQNSFQFWAAVVVVGLVLQVAGCTAGVWEDARETKVEGVGIEGLEVAGAVKAGEGRAVLRYGLDGREALFVLPVDGQGRPGGPFVYRGDKRTPQEILDDVSMGQRREILFSRLAYLAIRDRRGGECEEHGGGGGGWIWTRSYIPNGCSDLAVVALAPTGTGLEKVRGKCDGRGVTFPLGCVVMLLPPQQPRPAEDLAWARTKAALLTPVTVAADVVMYPSAIVLLFFFGPRC